MNRTFKCEHLSQIWFVEFIRLSFLKVEHTKDILLFGRNLSCLGDNMSVNPLEKYKQIDPKLIEHYDQLRDFAYAEGALSSKVKLLIAMAIDVEHGSAQGAIAIGTRALKMGASKEEIVEALRISYQIGGNQALFTSAQVLQALVK